MYIYIYIHIERERDRYINNNNNSSTNNDNNNDSCMCIYIYIYIYIHTYIHTYTHTCIYTLLAAATEGVPLPRREGRQSPARRRKRGNGFQEPPCISEPWLFSAPHGSKSPGFVLRPLSPYAIASLGAA